MKHPFRNSVSPLSVLFSLLVAAVVLAAPVAGAPSPADPREDSGAVEVHHGTIEAVDPRAGTITLDGKVHYVSFHGDFLPGSNGERVPLRQAIGLGGVVEYAGGRMSAAGQVKRADRVVVINVFH